MKILIPKFSLDQEYSLKQPFDRALKVIFGDAIVTPGIPNRSDKAPGGGPAQSNPPWSLIWPISLDLAQREWFLFSFFLEVV